jgi:hypothetical protein
MEYHLKYDKLKKSIHIRGDSPRLVLALLAIFEIEYKYHRKIKDPIFVATFACVESLRKELETS